jgi:hypothetical protein
LKARKHWCSCCKTYGHKRSECELWDQLRFFGRHPTPPDWIDLCSLDSLFVEPNDYLVDPIATQIDVNGADDKRSPFPNSNQGVTVDNIGSNEENDNSGASTPWLLADWDLNFLDDPNHEPPTPGPCPGETGYICPHWVKALQRHNRIKQKAQQLLVRWSNCAVCEGTLAPSSDPNTWYDPLVEMFCTQLRPKPLPFFQGKTRTSDLTLALPPSNTTAPPPEHLESEREDVSINSGVDETDLIDGSDDEDSDIYDCGIVSTEPGTPPVRKCEMCCMELVNKKWCECERFCRFCGYSGHFLTDCLEWQMAEEACYLRRTSSRECGFCGGEHLLDGCRRWINYCLGDYPDFPPASTFQDYLTKSWLELDKTIPIMEKARKHIQVYRAFTEDDPDSIKERLNYTNFLRNFTGIVPYFETRFQGYLEKIKQEPDYTPGSLTLCDENWKAIIERRSGCSHLSQYLEWNEVPHPTNSEIRKNWDPCPFCKPTPENNPSHLQWEPRHAPRERPEKYQRLQTQPRCETTSCEDQGSEGEQNNHRNWFIKFLASLNLATIVKTLFLIFLCSFLLVPTGAVVGQPPHWTVKDSRHHLFRTPEEVRRQILLRGKATTENLFPTTEKSRKIFTKTTKTTPTPKTEKPTEKTTPELEETPPIAIKYIKNQNFTTHERPFTENLRPLAAPVNLGMGVAATPTGVAIISTDYTLIPAVIHLAHPTFQPPELRSPRWDKLCPKTNPSCTGLLPAETNCLNKTQEEIIENRITKVYRDLHEKIRETYDHIVDSRYLATLMQGICAEHDSFCTDRETDLKTVNRTDGITQPDYDTIARQTRQGRENPSVSTTPAHVRNKRFVHLLGAMTGVLGTAMAAVNTVRVSQIKTNIDALDDYMGTTIEAVNFLQRGFSTIASHEIKVSEFMHHELLAIYRNIQATKCDAFLRHRDLYERLYFLNYENTLWRHVDAAFQMSITGRITPAVVSANSLRNIINSRTQLMQSLTARQPALAYEFGHAIPVKIDMDALEFSFILAIPTPKESDLITTYQMHNVGFHLKATDPMLYRAPFPDYIALAQNGVVYPFRQQYCENAPGIQHCTPGAIDPTEEENACLQFFLNDRFARPQDTYRSNYTWYAKLRHQSEYACFDTILALGEQRNPQTIQTQAGLLIRAFDNTEVSLVPTDINMPSGDDDRKLPSRGLVPAENGVYWVPHSRYRMITIGKYVYMPTAQETYSFVVNTSFMDRLPFYDLPLVAPGLGSMGDIRQLDRALRKLLEEQPQLIKYRGLPSSMMSNWMAYGLAGVFAIIAFVAVIKLAQCLRRRQLGRQKKGDSDPKARFSQLAESVTLLGDSGPPTSMGQLFDPNLYIVPRAPMPDYPAWRFAPFYWWYKMNKELLKVKGDLRDPPAVPPAAVLHRPLVPLRILLRSEDSTPYRLALTNGDENGGDVTVFDVTHLSPVRDTPPLGSPQRGPCTTQPSPRKSVTRHAEARAIRLMTRVEDPGIHAEWVAERIQPLQEDWDLGHLEEHLATWDTEPRSHTPPATPPLEGEVNVIITDRHGPTRDRAKRSWQVNGGKEPECQKLYAPNYMVNAHTARITVAGKQITFEGYTPRDDNGRALIALGKDGQVNWLTHRNPRSGPPASKATDREFVRAGLGFLTDVHVRRCNALIDTGADISIVSQKMAKHLGIKTFEEADRPRIKQADGSRLKWAGYVVGGLFLCGRVYLHAWYVPERGTLSAAYDMIIGTDLLEVIGYVGFDFDRQLIHLKDRERKAEYVFRMINRRCIIQTEGTPSLEVNQDVRRDWRDRFGRDEEDDGSPRRDQPRRSHSDSGRDSPRQDPPSRRDDGRDRSRGREHSNSIFSRSRSRDPRSHSRGGFLDDQAQESRPSRSRSRSASHVSDTPAKDRRPTGAMSRSPSRDLLRKTLERTHSRERAASYRPRSPSLAIPASHVNTPPRGRERGREPPPEGRRRSRSRSVPPPGPYVTPGTRNGTVHISPTESHTDVTGEPVKTAQ